MKLYTCILFLIFTMLLETAGQVRYSSSSKKALRSLDEGLNAYQARDFKTALTSLQEAIKADAAFYEAYFLMADIYLEMGDKQQLILSYQKALALNPEIFPGGWFNLAEALFGECRYQEALPAFSKYLAFKENPENNKRVAMKKLKDCEFAQQAMQDPVPFVSLNLGEHVNSNLAEYWPSLTADENTLSFTRQMLKNTQKGAVQGNFQEDIFFSNRQNQAWTEAQSLSSRVNSPNNEGAQSLSADGKTMYFTACNREDGKGLCDIYSSVLTPEGWSLPENLGSPVNTSSSEKQPAISPDGNTLYFASNREGSRGGLDLWCSKKDTQGNWQDPVNLGDSINTSWDEMAPFIHQDNQSLYFTSAGWPGMGGFDIYRSLSTGEGTWTRAKNIGFPINTCHDESGLIVNTRGTIAYYASNRIPEKGLDIYSFELYQAARPVSTSYLTGRVVDSRSRKPLFASCKLIDVNSGKLVNNVNSDQYTGEFLVTLPSERDYALNVSKKGYLFYSANLNLTGFTEAGNPYILDIALSPIQVGEKAILKNIFFETNSAILRNESRVELQKLLEFMQQNPGLTIEISGHTDTTGSTDYNMKLALNRARVVADFLLSGGMAASRITAKGYGSSMPVADNSTEEGRAQNRRTEYKIVGVN